LLRSLTPRAFRNLVDEPFAPGPGRQLLLGGNGAGKTSLLEAVYLAATTRSFRTADLAACLRHGEAAFHVALEAGEAGRQRLEMGWQRGARLRLWNGREASLHDHVAVQPLVLWSAGEGDLLDGAPALGRRLVDRGLASTQPRALATLAAYRQVLVQKRQLLAQGKAAYDRGADLATWNALLAEAAAAVIELRAAYVDALGRALDVVRARTPLDLPPLAIAYLPSPRAGREGAATILATLERIAPRERERGAPLLGPHRDALQLLWGGRPVGEVASAGEGKALGLLLAAAQGVLVEETERVPVYLLDDADAELDGRRLAAVWQAFPAGASLLATSSRPEVWEGLATEGRWRAASGRFASD
jgi:DNA replication and repair protein RecF